MRTALIIACCLAVVLCSPRNYYKEVASEAELGEAQANWYDEQLLDHFDKVDISYWSQKFYINDTYYTPGGPVLLFLGGEGPESPKCVGGYFYVNTFAKMLGGLIVDLEHRYYGESIPVEDYATENMHYLSSEQALADTARFISYFTDAGMYDVEGAPWIAIGGSYSGNLAAWMRLRYPHLIAGALASSAPVKAEVDYYQYFDVVQASLGTSSYGNQCTQAVADAVTRAETLIATKSGRDELFRMFNLCDDIDYSDVNDVANFMSLLDDPIAGTIQYAKPGDIEALCTDIVDGPNSSTLENIAELVAAEYYPGCVDASYQSTIDSMLDLDPTAETASERAWTWQCCTEFSYWQTGTTSDVVSELVDVDYFHSWCSDVFGIEAEEADMQTAQTNVLYGAEKQRISNVFYANGDVDPWHALGNMFDNPASPRYVMHGTSHCADMYATKLDDPAPLATIREFQLQAMNEWIRTWKA
ncbi:peptidase S28 [Kipferlia bialata]|uniref:Peptidase S28 n=1 Tax=Kipferlia bialata TaxID=797122 RepID=A0A9K3D0F6_9EUKA|nr:peptidase S28 [Kipferlia bialata]GIQ84979.1 peptidase S28 [Kipferlia bialata]|eukprot:g4008.t1